MATREVTLGGQSFTVPIDWTDVRVAEEAIRAGHIASAAEAFPRPDFAGAVSEAQSEAQGGLLRQFARGGVGGTIADTLVGASELTGVADESEFIQGLSRDRAAREQLPEQGAHIGGEIATDIAMLGGLRSLLPVVASEAGLQFLRAEEGERIQQGAEGGAGALVGFGLGRLAEGAIESARGAFRGLRESAELRRAPRETSVRLGLDEAVDEAPTEAFGDRLIRLADDTEPEAFVSQGATRRELVRNLDRLGFPLTPGQKTGSPSRRQIEAGLASAPPTARPFADMAEQQQRRTAQLIARGIGENADELSPAVLDRAVTRIGGQFQDIARDLPSNVMEGAGASNFENSIRSAMGREIQDIVNRGTPEAGLTATPILRNVLDAMNEGPVSGRELMAWRSSIVNEIQSLSRERGTSAQGSALLALSDSVDAIDRLIGDVAPESVGDAYRVARGQWRLLNSVLKTSAVDQLGDIRPRSLANVLSREYPTEFRRGRFSGENPARTRGEQDIANAFDAVRGLATIAPEIVANSGTPTRLFVQNAVQEATPQSLLALGARLTIGDSISNAALAAPSLTPPATQIPPLLRRAGAAAGAAGAEGALAELLGEE